MTKPWRINLHSAWNPISRQGRYRFQRISSKLKNKLKRRTSKRRRQIMKNFDGYLSNSKILNPYTVDGDWYGKWFYKKS